MSKGKITCIDCGKQWFKKELKVMPDADADEGGVYVVYDYVCPCCLSVIRDRRLKRLTGYYAPSNDEPLRWES